MLLLIAGSRREAYDWADDHNINPAKYKVIMDYDEMAHMSIDNNELVFIGTWGSSERTKALIERLMKSQWKHMIGAHE